MVDQASKIDVEASMRTRTWSTDEFQHVLTIQTEQVGHSSSMFSAGQRFPLRSHNSVRVVESTTGYTFTPSPVWDILLPPA